jgi:peptidylprolyl isomerase domain and WD repeat-containing protein 1
MINMIKFEFTPRSVCWIHQKGQAQALIAVYVTCSYSALHFCDANSRFYLSSRTDKDSSDIHIFDGRGDGKAIHTISKLHSHPVHLMTVSDVERLYNANYHGTIAEKYTLVQL